MRAVKVFEQKWGRKGIKVCRDKNNSRKNKREGKNAKQE
jgi:hypothetical protein